MRRLAGQGAVGTIVVVLVLPLLKTLGEPVGVVDDLTFEDDRARRSRWGENVRLPVQPGCAGRIFTCPMPLSSRCQRKAEPNSCPLSVCTCSTWNGSLAKT